MGTVFGLFLNPWEVAPMLALSGAAGLSATGLTGLLPSGRLRKLAISLALLAPPLVGLVLGANEFQERISASNRALAYADPLGLREAEVLRKEGLLLWRERGVGVRIELEEMSPEARTIAEEIQPAELRSPQSLSVLIALGNSTYLLIKYASSFTYLDIRALANAHTQIIGYDFIQDLLGEQRTRSTSWLSFSLDRRFRWTSPDVFSGRVLRDDEGAPRAIVVARSGRS